MARVKSGARILSVALAVAIWLPAAGYSQPAVLQPAKFSESVRKTAPTRAPGVLRGFYYAAPGKQFDVTQLAVVLPSGGHVRLCLTIETQDGRYFAEAAYAVGGLAGPRRYGVQLLTKHRQLLEGYAVRDVAMLAFLAARCDAEPQLFLPLSAAPDSVGARLVLLVNNSTPGIDARVYHQKTRRYFECTRDEESKRLVAFDTECRFELPARSAPVAVTLVRNKYGHDLDPLNLRVYLP